MLDDRDVVVRGEALAGPLEHRRREVEPNPGHVGPSGANQREQPAVARTDVEHTLGRLGQQTEQHLLAFGAMRDGAGLAQVGQRMVDVGPPVDAHPTSLGAGGR